VQIKESGVAGRDRAAHPPPLEVADEVIVLDRGGVDYTGPANDVGALMEAFHPSDVENPLDD
jgi:hypothetical protein